MDTSVLLVFLVGYVGFRLASLVVSILNEKKLLAGGAKEYGKFNTLVLFSVHALYFASAAWEGVSRNVQFDAWAWTSVGLFVFSYTMLVLVLAHLKQFWTTKIIVSPEHVFVSSGLYRWVKHPNYFLNIIPELIGVAFLLKAWISFAVFFPLYLIVLFVRIRQENRAMSGVASVLREKE